MSHDDGLARTYEQRLRERIEDIEPMKRHTFERKTKTTEESPEIYRYPFDDKNPFSNTMIKYNDSYGCRVYCANCKYHDNIRIKNGVAKSGLIYKCNNCKVYHTL